MSNKAMDTATAYQRVANGKPGFRAITHRKGQNFVQVFKPRIGGMTFAVTCGSKEAATAKALEYKNYCRGYLRISDGKYILPVYLERNPIRRRLVIYYNALLLGVTVTQILLLAVPMVVFTGAALSFGNLFLLVGLAVKSSAKSLSDLVLTLRNATVAQMKILKEI